MASRVFSTNSYILKEKHFFFDFQFQINETWALLQKESNLAVVMPPSAGKTTILQNLHTHITKNTRETPFFMDFSHFSRNAMSSFDKFLPELKNLFYINARQISTQMTKLVQDSPFNDKKSLITFLERMNDTIEERSFLLIDNADECIKHDPFSEFLGLVLKKQVDRKAKSGSSFHSILISGKKNIIQFRPFQRGLDDSDYFLTWLSKEVYSTTVPINKDSVNDYLAEYTSDIGFTFDQNVTDELLEKSNANLLNINKILKFIDEKLVPYKKHKNLTTAEVQHAAGYVLANIGQSR